MPDPTHAALPARSRSGLLALFVAVSLAAGARAQFTTRVSPNPAGVPGGSGFDDAALSASGRFVAFVSDAPDIYPGPDPQWAQVYVRDRQTSLLVRVSVGPAGVSANEACESPALSADGRFVAFVSRATNLVVSPPGNGYAQVFVHDRQTGATEIASINQNGVPASWDCADPSLSGDGRVVVFASRASNLVPGYIDTESQIYARDRQLWTTSLLSQSTGGAAGYLQSYRPHITPDGRFVVFASDSGNLDPSVSLSYSAAYLRDRAQETTRCVSLGAGGAIPNSVCFDPTISDDGRFVAFSSPATNLVPGQPTNPSSARMNVFTRDRQTGDVAWISRPAPNACHDGDSAFAAISGNGAAVVFLSESDLTGCCSYAVAAFVAQRASGALLRVDLSPDDFPLGVTYAMYNVEERRPSISGAGDLAAFVSQSFSGYPNIDQVYARALSGCGPGSWRGPSGGLFHSAANWCGSAMPGASSQASFKADAPVTVLFATNPAIGSMLVTDGQPTLDLAGRTLALLSDAPDALRVSAACPTYAALTIRRGQVFARGGVSIGNVYPFAASALGHILVDGPDASLLAAGGLRLVSGYEEGDPPSSLRIHNGARAALASAEVGGLDATIEVADPGSLLEIDESFSMYSRLEVRAGGTAVAHADSAGSPAFYADGAVLLTDAGSLLDVGDEGVGTLATVGSFDILHGARARCDRATDTYSSYYYPEPSRLLRISGAGSTLECADRADLGSEDHSTLTIEHGGALSAPQISLDEHLSTFGDGGVLRGSVANNALLLPGDAPSIAAVPNSQPTPGIGSLAIDGDFHHDLFGVMLIDLALPANPGGGHDSITVTGLATLEGGLVAFAPPGFSPPFGASFDILVAGARTGEFGFVSLPDLPAPKRLTPYYLSTGVRLVVTDRCPGDANGDGVIDFFDLNIVVGQYGQTGGGLPGDLNHDGAVDFLDLAIVLAAFGHAC